ncbi:FimV/HubP family polar landmark protein [Paraburkholderia lycopersici]|uniref:FimV/HubP family polar landmark protein n=1 Tax=Paraburkholderia lycopersici TaxID=416944 RepID=UPI0011612D19|nr:FimV/HubP family polar landmark protein [Paraburkholderia lycopersici]
MSLLLCGVAAAQGGASGASGAAAPGAVAAGSASNAGRYTVHPGQSLHDVAVDLTQSHDKATLARMSQALFDANPNAFIKHDASRMRAGAVLSVPATPDVSSAAAGMTAVSSANASTAAAGASAATTAPAASAPRAPAPAPAVPPSASAASAASVGAPAGASSATAQAVSAASSAASAAATGANAASAASANATSAPAVAASGSEAVAQAVSGASAASSASDSHVWSGAIQSAPSASGVAFASGASGAAKAATPVTVSSLQQLLALKNRVLMALQQHGIAKQTQVAGGSKGTSAGASAAQGRMPAQAGGATNTGAAGGQLELTPVALGVLAAIVVVVLALFVRLLTRKRGKAAEQAHEAPATPEPTPAAAGQPPVSHESHESHEPAAPAEAQPRVNEAAPAAPAESGSNEVTVTPVPTPEISSEPLERDATLGHAETASVEATAGLGADALPPLLTEPLQPAAPQEPPAAEHAASLEGRPHDVEPEAPQTLADATEAASLAEAAELGAEALPPESLAAPRAAEDAEASAHTLEELPRAHEPATPDVEPDSGNAATQVSQAEPPIAHPPHEAAASGQPLETSPVEPEVPAVPAEDMKYAEVPIEFPHDAVEALSGIGLPLPPRIGEPVMPAEPLSTGPVATPEASAHLSTPLEEPPAPMAGEAIEAGMAGALAGLGAPRFGTLTLDFDLNLPPDSAEPLPVFTPEQLSRIARNKLDLAHEYIALGDVAGARSLINEVIESNDHATRSDAQALLSTLAPLS